MRDPYDVSGLRPPTPKPPRADWPYRRLLVFVVVSMAAFFVLIIAMLLVQAPAKPTGPSTYEGFMACRQFVEHRLIAPGTAKFADFSRESVQLWGDGHIVVASYVDAQNGFGALIRTTYRCSVQAVGGSWRLDYLLTDP